jgi:hypothetical protein
LGPYGVSPPLSCIGSSLLHWLPIHSNISGMRREELTVPACGIRCWLTKRLVPSGAMVEPGTPICLFEVSTGAFTDGPEADIEFEAYARGIVHWAPITEADIVKHGQVIGWFDTE